MGMLWRGPMGIGIKFEPSSRAMITWRVLASLEFAKRQQDDESNHGEPKDC